MRNTRSARKHLEDCIARTTDRIRRGIRPAAVRTPGTAVRPHGHIEVLERRVLLTDVPLGALQFRADNFVQAAGKWAATGTIEMGLKPTGAEAFNPLVEIQGGVEFVPDAPTFTVTAGDLYIVAGEQHTELFSVDARSLYNVADWTGASGSGLAASGDTKVFGPNIKFALRDVRFGLDDGAKDTSGAEVKLHGDLTLAPINLTASFIGDSYVTVGEGGVGLENAPQLNETINVTPDVSIGIRDVGWQYDGSKGLFGISGTASVTSYVPKTNHTKKQAEFAGGIGIALTNGELTELSVTVSGAGTIKGLAVNVKSSPDEVRPQKLTFGYRKGDDGHAYYEAYGTLTVKVGGSEVTAQLGEANDSRAKPGLVIEDDALTKVDMGLSGTLAVYGLKVELGGEGKANPVKLVYVNEADGSDFQVTGTVSVPRLWGAEVSLGNNQAGGLEIKDGEWELHSLDLKVGHVNLGAFQVEDFEVGFEHEEGAVIWTGGATVMFPGGFGIGGKVTVKNGALDALSVTYSAGTTQGIPVAQTGLFVTYINVSLANLETPGEIVATGTVSLFYGQAVTIRGQAGARMLAVTGSVLVNKDEMVVTADAVIGAIQTSEGKVDLDRAIIGKGDASLVLDWGERKYSLDARLELFDGAVKIDGGFDLEPDGALTIFADAELDVPDSVPFIGGREVIGGHFLFRHLPADVGKSFAAAWLEFTFPKKFDIGVEYNFADKNFHVIGTSDVDEFQAQLTQPVPRTFRYTSPMKVTAGTTAATLSVQWPRPKLPLNGDPKVSLMLPDGTILSQDDLNPDHPKDRRYTYVPPPQEPTGAGGNGDDDPDAVDSSAAVHIVGDPDNDYQPIHAGGDVTYTLILDVTVYEPPNANNPPFADAGDLAFHLSQHLPRPVIRVGQVTRTPGNPNVWTVAYSGKAARDADVTVFASFADPTGVGTAQPVLVGDQKLVSFRVHPVNGAFNGTVNWDVSGDYPLPQYVYARIDDDANTQVSSDEYLPKNGQRPSATSDPQIIGSVSDFKTGQNLTGWRVYVDLNRNGQYDPPSPPNGGNPGGPGEPTAITDDRQGNAYAITDDRLRPGDTVSLAVVVPPGYRVHPGTTNPRDVTIKQLPENVGFSPVVDRLASVTGLVFEDLNQNGARDAGEPGLSGLTLRAVARGGDGQPITVRTDRNGKYEFVGLSAQTTYDVTFVPDPAGYFQTKPQDQPLTFSRTIGDALDQQTGTAYAVLPLTVIAGTVTGYALGSNGQLGPNPTPRGGWTVNLYGSGGSGPAVASTTTAADGTYRFGGLRPGNYVVREEPLSGWRQVAPFSSNFALGSGHNTLQTPSNSLAVADFDRDGRSDVAALNPLDHPTADVSIMFGRGGRAFDGPYNQTVSFGGGVELAATDIDGDGYADLALVSPGGQVDVLFNQQGKGGSRSFANAPNFASLEAGATVLDARPGRAGTGDPYGGLFVLYQVAAGDQLLTKVAVLTPGTRGFVVTTVVAGDASRGAPPARLAVGDWNVDGYLDAVVNAPAVDGGNFVPQVRLLLGDGTGRFPSPTITHRDLGAGAQPSASAAAGAVAVGDINNDHLIDLVTYDPTRNTVVYLLNNAVSGFQDQATTFPLAGGQPMSDLLLKDLNGDTRADLFGLPTNGATLTVAVNQGTAGAYFANTAQAPFTPRPGQPSSLRGLTSGDLDNDGLTDLLMADTA